MTSSCISTHLLHLLRMRAGNKSHSTCSSSTFSTTYGTVRTCALNQAGRQRERQTKERNEGRKARAREVRKECESEAEKEEKGRIESSSTTTNKANITQYCLRQYLPTANKHSASYTPSLLPPPLPSAAPPRSCSRPAARLLTVSLIFDSSTRVTHTSLAFAPFPSCSIPRFHSSSLPLAYSPFSSSIHHSLCYRTHPYTRTALNDLISQLREERQPCLPTLEPRPEPSG